MYGAVFHDQFLPTRRAKWPPPHFAAVTCLKRCCKSNLTCLPGRTIHEISPREIALLQFGFFVHVGYEFRIILMYAYTISFKTVFWKGPILETLSLVIFFQLTNFRLTFDLNSKIRKLNIESALILIYILIQTCMYLLAKTTFPVSIPLFID